MEKFNIEMTKDEMIRYYANKIVEDGIKDCFEFSNIVDINNYGNIEKYKNEILERIYRDERVADVNLDNEGNFDLVFYTDFCPFYYDIDLTLDDDFYIDQSLERDLLKEFIYYYSEKCLFDNPYISIRNLINQFAEEQTENREHRTAISNMIKKNLNESDFLEKNIDGIEVYITPKNYKQLEKVIEECLQSFEQEELE